MEEHTWGSVKCTHLSRREEGVGHGSEKTRDVANPGVQGERLVEHLRSRLRAEVAAVPEARKTKERDKSQQSRLRSVLRQEWRKAELQRRRRSIHQTDTAASLVKVA
jgi:hypothetical protein